MAFEHMDPKYRVKGVEKGTRLSSRARGKAVGGEGPAACCTLLTRVCGLFSVSVSTVYFQETIPRLCVPCRDGLTSHLILREPLLPLSPQGWTSGSKSCF